MKKKRGLLSQLLSLSNDQNFLKMVEAIQTLVSKVLSAALLVVILVALVDLIVVLFQSLLASPVGFFNTTIIEVFGLFLNILIALELLENITAYLRKQVFQVELVIATSLIAVARKIIIFDLSKYSNNDLIALAAAIFALSISYWLVRRLNPR